MRLTVRYSIAYGCWMWEVTHGYGQRWTGWRSTYPEAVELGLEDLLAQDAERRNGVKVVNVVEDAALWSPSPARQPAAAHRVEPFGS